MSASPTRCTLRATVAALCLLHLSVALAAPTHDPRTDRQLELGMRLYSEGHLDEAVAAIRAGQAIEPRPEFLYALGQIERHRNRCLQAIEYYELYLETHPRGAAAAAARTQIERCRAEATVATDPVARAQLHFQAGEAAFRLGHYDDAVREWKAGYELSPRPLFLLDLGQAYRRLDDPQRALAMYEQFLHALAPDDPKRAEIERTLEQLRVEASRHEAKTDVLVDLAPAPAVAPPVVAPTVVAKRSFARRHWWIFPTVAGVAIAGGLAIGLGHYGRATNRLDCDRPGVTACIPATGAP